MAYFIYSVIAGLLIFALLLGPIFAASQEHHVFDIDVMLEALREVENWDSHSVGADGERGPWQITAGAWFNYSHKPFSWAHGRSLDERLEQRRVAREIVYSIVTKLESKKRKVDAYTVALIYCAGESAFYYHVPHCPSKTKRAYAKRADNLYQDLIKKHHANEENESR